MAIAYHTDCNVCYSMHQLVANNLSQAMITKSNLMIKVMKTTVSIVFDEDSSIFLIIVGYSYWTDNISNLAIANYIGHQCPKVPSWEL